MGRKLIPLTASEHVELAEESEHTAKCVDSVVLHISKQLAEGKNWAIEQFLLNNPNINQQYIEVVELQGNPFAYFIRVLEEL